MYMTAGISVTVTKKNMNKNVLIFDDGKRIKYEPRTPEIAPDAPSMGILDAGVRMNCARFPIIPAAR